MFLYRTARRKQQQRRRQSGIASHHRRQSNGGAREMELPLLLTLSTLRRKERKRN